MRLVHYLLVGLVAGAGCSRDGTPVQVVTERELTDATALQALIRLLEGPQAPVEIHFNLMLKELHQGTAMRVLPDGDLLEHYSAWVVDLERKEFRFRALRRDSILFISGTFRLIQGVWVAEVRNHAQGLLRNQK